MWFLTVSLAIAALLLAGVLIYYILHLKSYRGLAHARAELHQAQTALQDFAKVQMLQGNVPSFEKLADFYRIYGFTFPADAFMLLVIKVRRHPYEGTAGLADAYAAVQEELTGILGLYVQLNFVELEGVLACFYCEPRVSITPPSQNQASLRRLLAQHCTACAAALWENTKIDIMIAVGHYDMGGFALHTNFISTKALLEQAMSSKWEENVIASQEQLTQRTAQGFPNLQRQFYNCFVCFKYELAAEHLFQMVRLRIRDYFDSFEEAREIVAEQLRFCTNMLELPLNVQLTLSDGSTIDIRALMASPDEPTLQTNLNRYFSALALHVDQSTIQSTPSTARVHDYILANYADSSISVTSIGEKFHLNISLLSRQFKHEYGQGVLEFIHRTRIAKAKELISAGRPINEVSAAVGYTSRRALDSAFTRYESITPKTYQDRL